jgi:hypothetical protein
MGSSEDPSTLFEPFEGRENQTVRSSEEHGCSSFLTGSTRKLEAASPGTSD